MRVVRPQTAEALLSAKAGRSWREVATSLGKPESFAATLSAVAKRTPGAASAKTEREIRLLLGIEKPRTRKSLFDLPVRVLRNAIRDRVEI